MSEDLVVAIRHHNRDIVAKAAVDTLIDAALSSPKDHVGSTIIQVTKALLEQNKDNILVKNYIKFLLEGVSASNYQKKLMERKGTLHKAISESKGNIYKHMKSKAALNRKVLFHSINHEIIYAITQNTKTDAFQAYTTKHTDMYKARHILEGKKVKFVGDMDLLSAIKSCDMCVVGADLLQKDKAVAKKGSGLCMEIASTYLKPTYLCCSGFVYDPHRTHNVEDYGKHYEVVNAGSSTGIISEHGIHKLGSFIRETEHFNPWMHTKDF
jgi:translation initiation factor 2B subunit (eIF-2B alpha/beta/delta family)